MSLATIARWHREHHAARQWMPSGELADVARRNLRALGREETAEAVEAVEAEVRRLQERNAQVAREDEACRA